MKPILISAGEHVTTYGATHGNQRGFGVLEAIFLMLGIVIFVALALSFFRPAPESVNLSLTEFRCTKHSTQTDTSLMLVGKVMIPKTTTRKVCDRWERVES